ncbi:hypothetical protein [Flavobacterium beibuense]|uniref:Transmembrane protein n=1 Tax=Flavobacterium beibuense TaxID=657326 RepID=A0A444WET3_9FLAO|nr:hypothetical protein [Flavobacterium beibuense]RYJ44292.1 hypothetical protein NU09_0902 [Flavobacterium beibuense]
MSKFSEEIIAIVATFLGSIFLPKHLITLIREVIKFMFFSVFRKWYILIILSIAIIYFNYLSGKVLGDFYSVEFSVYLFLTNVIVIFIITLFQKLYRNYKPINIAFYGCFTIKENEYLTIDIDAENLNERIEKTIENISASFHTYKKHFIKPINIDLPKFIPIALGPRKLNRYIKNRVNAGKHLASIHFTRNINDQNLSIVVNYNKNSLVQTKALDNLEKLINDLALDKAVHSTKLIEISIKIYMLYFGQSIMDMFIDFKKFTDVHYMIDDMEKLLKGIGNDIADIPDKHKSQINLFISFWSSYIERYRSIILLEQGQTLAAFQHIMKSIKYNPFYPYEDYESLKQDYTKRYAIEVISKMPEFYDDTEADIARIEENFSIMGNLVEQIEHPFATYNYEIIKEILRRDSSQKMIDYLEDSFSQLDKDNPFILLSMSEVIRYAKKGTEKINEIYAERVDEAIDLLKKVIEIDNDFAIIHSKIGTVIWMKGIHYENEEITNEGIEEMRKGMHYISQVGLGGYKDNDRS